MICFRCRKFGHSKEECLRNKQTGEEVNQGSNTQKKLPENNEPLPYGPSMQISTSLRMRKLANKGDVKVMPKAGEYGVGSSQFVVLKEKDDRFKTLERERQAVGEVRPIENSPKELFVAVRTKSGKNKAKTMGAGIAPSSDFVFKGPLRSFVAAMGKKSHDQSEKAISEKIRKALNASKKKNGSDCIQLEVNKYTEGLARIPCSTEANVEMVDTDASLDDHDPPHPLF